VSLRNLRHLLEYFLVRVFLSLVQVLSLRTCHDLCRFTAWLAHDVFRVRGRIVEENLQIAFPEKTAAQRQQIGRATWEHLLLMVCEIALVPRTIHETNWRNYVHRYNHRLWLQTIFRNGPKICVTGHIGNFELLGYVGSFWGMRMYTVVRTLDNPYLDRMMLRFRASMGQRILPKDNSANQADEVLQTGGLLGLLGDQNAGRQGVVADFMGRPASCHKALALFSLVNKAPMMVTSCTRRGNQPMQFEMGLDDVIDMHEVRPETEGVSELTQWYNDVLERRIRDKPDQYWWVHDRWKHVPVGKRRRKKRVQPAAEAAKQPAEAQRPAA
jgi:Kdo2-lipid IVA lauroyltransferase/acyltransferase